MKPVVLAVLLLATSASGSSPPSPSPPPGGQTPPPAPFRDVTESSGVAFTHSNAARGQKLLPETMGGGVAFFDYDGDGDSDLLLVDSAGESTPGHAGAVLYRNDGPGPGGVLFTDVTLRSGLAEAVPVDPKDPYGTFYGMGVAAADYDGDGWIDVYLTAAGGNRLLRNSGGTFQDVTDRAGVGGARGSETAWSTGAAFFDADGDGDLDLFVCNYLEWSPELDRTPESIAERTVATADGGTLLTYGRPQTYRGVHPFLFLNRGDGSFEEVGEKAGLHVDDHATGEPVAKALAVAPVDLDRDGRLDLFVANDTTRNLVFHNRGPGDDGVPRFEETGELYGLAYDPHGNTTGAMGIDWGYLTPTGPGHDDLSILVGNYGDEPTSHYRAQGDPTFFADDAQRTGIAGPTHQSLTFGLLLLDYDLDGRLDLLAANGHVEPDIRKIDPRHGYEQPAQLFWNAGEAPGAGGRAVVRLVEVPPEQLGDLARPLVGRGAAYADIDGDGDLDVVLTQIGGAARVLRNDRESGPGKLLRLAFHAPGSRGIGAVVETVGPGGPARRDLMPSRSYLSQVDPGLTLAVGPDPGLGGSGRIVVTWADGARESFGIASPFRSGSAH